MIMLTSVSQGVVIRSTAVEFCRMYSMSVCWMWGWYVGCATLWHLINELGPRLMRHTAKLVINNEAPGNVEECVQMKTKQYQFYQTFHINTILKVLLIVMRRAKG